MSSINRQNYEAYYLDYLEGNLDGKKTAELLLFLENNPELKSELEDTDLITLGPDMNVNFDTSNLHQHINESNVEDYIITSIENEIAEEDAKELATYLKKNPEAKTLATRYQKTILPKEEILFPNKSKLKRRSATIYYLIPAISAAAIVLIFFLVNPPSSNTDLPISFDPTVNHSIDSAQEAANDMEELVNLEKDEIKIEKARPTEIKEIVEIKAPQIPRPDQKVEEEFSNANIEEIAEAVNLIPAVQKDEEKEKKILPPKPIEKSIAIHPNEKIVDPGKNDNVPDLPKVDLEEKESVAANEEIIKIEIDEAVVAEEEDEKIADIENVDTESIEALRVGQLLNRGIRKNVLNEKSPSTDRVQGNEIIAAVADKVDRRVKPKVNYKYKKNKKSRSFALSIGSFEFSRTKSE